MEGYLFALSGTDLSVQPQKGIFSGIFDRSESLLEKTVRVQLDQIRSAVQGTVTLGSKSDALLVMVSGGSVVPFQESVSQFINSSKRLQQSPSNSMAWNSFLISLEHLQRSLLQMTSTFKLSSDQAETVQSCLTTANQIMAVR